MQRDENVATEYRHFMREFESLQHMHLVDDDGERMSDERVAYLPHHGIWQASDRSKKLRVIFDASRKLSSGTSLNDVLHTGPALQMDLITIFLWWRTHRFVIVADIEKIFRQIRVDPDLVNDLPEGDRLRPQWRDFGGDQTVRTLGIAWDPIKDEFRYRVSELPSRESPSKRSALSVIARLFDPLSW